MAATVLHEVMAAPDKGIPEEVMEHAKCVAVVPHMIKGGFVFGAEGGRGVATCRTEHGWSAPAFFAITGGSWGLQIGVEGVDLVMIIQNDQGMKHLLASKFQIGADASAAAGPVGRHASADTDWKMNAEILTYSRAKGVFAGLTLSWRGCSSGQGFDERPSTAPTSRSARSLPVLFRRLRRRTHSFPRFTSPALRQPRANLECVAKDSEHPERFPGARAV